mgnify:CR=1 FL=1|tara:strand:- start:10996 stop:11595 length:600 start_codon:yes stop_codon:yes gene_type:complete
MGKNSINDEDVRIIEAMLFSSPDPLTQKKVDLCYDENPPSLKKIIDELEKEYSKDSSSVFIQLVAGGYRLVTKPEYHHWVKRLFTRVKKSPLSHAALEALSIIAYKGPINRSELESIRGVNSGSVVKTLLDRNLIKISGRGKGPGKPLLYTVTDKFLISFGLNKVSDLPKIKEISELIKEHQPTENEAIHASDQVLGTG